MKKILLTLSLCWLAPAAFAQEGGLFVCESAGGVKNIVSADKRSGNCKPYEKGMFGGGGEATTVPSPHGGSTAPTVSGGFFSSSPGSGGLFAESVNRAAAPVAEKAPVPQTAPVAEKSDIIQIYYCPDHRGGRIIEDTSPPEPSCRSVGAKASEQDPRGKRPPAATPGTATAGAAPAAAEQNAPTDIYKCFDQNGLPSFVAGDQIDKFRRCTFFSRSFAGAKADFTRQATDSSGPSLTQLAARGVGAQNSDTPQPTSSAALRCVGAGSVEFNGSTREYNCATRSFDHTPGTSGGQIVSADRSANISAHRLDYLASAGSCGGAVTTPEGRILHLEPTKDCPEEFKIEARRIEQEYVKTISVNVSGALRERQRALAPQINEIANRIGVDPFLVHAVISAESAYKSRAVSHAGAQGLMQLMPGTAKRFGVSDPFHTGENIRGGTTYLKYLLKLFNGNVELALAGYNAGEGNVKKYGYKIPPFIETRAYVPKVLEYYRRYKADPSLIGL